MKIGLAMMSHETNTFSPVVTDLARFSGGRAQPLSGQAAMDVYRDTASCLGGYLKIAHAHGTEIVMGIAANAPPSGPVDDAAYTYMTDAIMALASEVDALLLDLHGAMVTQSYTDGEGELLTRLKTTYPDLPIGISLDMHANITEAMVSNCDVLTGYHTYPHIDMDNTAERGAEIFFDLLSGTVSPTIHWGNVPMLPHVMRQGTDDEPNKSLQARAIQLESQDCLAVSVFTGFPHADIRDAGLSTVVITDDNADQARQYCDELLDQAWTHREQFVYEVEPLAESMAKAHTAAAATGDGPVLLLDHYDNTASGGTMDTTEVLAAIIEAGLESVAVFGFYDPAAVQALVEAGIGGTASIQLGGKLAMPALSEQSTPLELEGEVIRLSNGKFKARVPMSRGLTINMGTTGVLRVGSVDIVIVSRHVEPYDPECLRSLGLEPNHYQYVMLKSRIHYRVGFKPIAKEIIECAGRGVCTSNYDEVVFQSVRRPIFPLDKME